MRREILALAVIVLVVAGGVVVYLLTARAFPNTSNVSISTEERAGNNVTAGSESGLELQLALNTTGLTMGQSIAIQVQEYNPSKLAANVTSKDGMASRILGIGMPPCDFENEPISLAVAKGDYSPANFTSAAPLQLVSDSASYSCAPIWTAYYWVFQPMSNVTQLGGCLGSICSPEGLVFSTIQTVQASGTWGIGSTSTLTPFAPGVYTVIAGDEWGAIAILHFRVAG